jgi:dTMP kinase
MSKIIVIEGPDRVGKATQTNFLANFLSWRGFKVLTIEVPIRTNLVYHIIYWMLKNGLAKKFPKCFQWLQYFNRQLFQWFTLKKLEKEYDYIIMDRWSLSTVVYGKATGVPTNFTEKLHSRLRTPEFTFLLLGPSHKHSAEDVYESDTALQESVRKIYLEWSKQHPHSCKVIDCTQPREIIAEEIRTKLNELNL